MSGYDVQVSSIYGGQLRQPLVQVQWGDRKPFTISPAEARDLAANLLGAAEAAEQDAFVVEFAREKLDCTDQHAGAFLTEFRRWREEYAAKGSGG